MFVSASRKCEGIIESALYTCSNGVVCHSLFLLSEDVCAFLRHLVLP